MDAHEDFGDPSGRTRANRSMPRRGAPPGRPQTGWSVTVRWFWVTLVTVAIATAVLIALVASVS